MMPGTRSRLALVATACSVTLIAGCRFSGEVPEPPVQTQAATETAALGDAGASLAPSVAFGGDDRIFGPFRRGSVPVPADLLAAAADQCRLTPTPSTTAEVGDRRVAVSDLRGDGRVLIVFADDEGAVGCRVAVAEDGSLRASFFRLERPSPALADAGLELKTMEYVDESGGQLVIAAGQVGDLGVHVRAGFDDDTYTTATIDDGWWLMWWPGQARPASITADDNKNVVIASVEVP